MKGGFRKYRGRVVIGLIVLCIAGLALRCTDNKCSCEPREQGPEWQPVTRDSLLSCLCHAYEVRDINAYGGLLYERFQFQFVPVIGESIGLPPGEPWWGKTEELAATMNLFESEVVTGIEMSLDAPVWYPCKVIRVNELDPPDTLEGFRTRVVPDIRITIQERGNEELIFIVNRTWLDIEVVPDQYEDGLWQVVTMTESAMPGGAPGRRVVEMTHVNTTSWSYIKFMFW